MDLHPNPLQVDVRERRSRPIVGSDTLTIVRSITVMKNATASSANARQRLIRAWLFQNEWEVSGNPGFLGGVSAC